MEKDNQRQLVAVLFADIAGYTALMHSNEEDALKALHRFKAIMEEFVPSSGGRLVQFYGDGCLASFGDAARAVVCAREMQLAFLADPGVPVRMGIHLGDVVFREGNAFGDSVNTASRIESMGVPGAVLYSEPVRNQVRNREIASISLGKFRFKNIPDPMEVFALEHPGLPVPKKDEITGKFAPPARKSRAAYWLGGLAVLLLLAIITWRLVFPTQVVANGTQEAGYEGLAIFPFEPADEDSDLTYLSDGIPENLINRLSLLPELKVFSRTATFTLRDSAADLSRVRHLIPAKASLTGQIRKVDDFLVLNCQLTDLGTGRQLWGNKITQKLSHVIALEDTLVHALIPQLEQQLKINVSPVVSKSTDHPEAYDEYMQGRHLTYGSTLDESETAITHFRKAIEYDSRFAEAYAAIANEKIIQAIFSTESRAEIFAEAGTMAQSALALDPTLTEAFLVQAAIAFYRDFDWDEADLQFRQALAGNPKNVTALIRYSAFLGAMGRDEEAIELALQAVRLDPVSISSLHNLGWVRYLAKDYTGAKQAFGKALSLHPTWIWGFTKKGYSHVQLNECDTAIDLALKGTELLGEWGSEVLRATFIFIHSRCGNQEKAREMADHFFAHIDEHGHEDPLAVMFVHYAFGEYDDAIKWARVMVEERSPSAYLLIIESFWDEELYNHPDFNEILVELGVQEVE